MISVTQTGLNAVQKELNVLSNNLANASTVGFKRSYTNFGDIFSNDPASNPKTSIGMGITTQSVSRDTTQGALKSTSNVTDLAIDGQGYFVLSTNLPTEPLITKVPPVIPPFNGNGLTLSSNLQPPPPPIPIPPYNGENLPSPINLQYSPTVKLRLFNNDDLVDVTIDGTKGRVYNNGIPLTDKVYDLTKPNELGITINPSGSELTLAFGNVYTAWSYGYSLDINGKNIISETTPPYWQSKSMPGNNINTPDNYTPTRPPLTINIPNLNAIDNRQSFDWVTAYNNAANKNYVQLKTVGYGGPVDPAKFTGNFDQTSDGFTGRYQYISFGDPTATNVATPNEARYFKLQNLDLTNIKQLSFDAIRGNNVNGGKSPESAGEEFGVYYLVDGVFKEIKSSNSAALTTLSNTSSDYNSWKNEVFDIPPEARKPNTQIMFKQEVNTYVNNANLWGISNIDLIPDTQTPKNSSQIYTADTIFAQSGKLYMNVADQGSGIGNNTGFIGRDRYLNFGGDPSNASNVVRAIDFKLDLTGYDTFKFDAIHGNGTNGGKQPTSDENLGVYYSLDNGTTFKEISTGAVNFASPNIYPSNSTLSGTDSTYNNWNDASFKIPEEARGNNTVIRFAHKIQNSSNDNLWGVANITLGTSLNVQQGYTQSNDFSWGTNSFNGTSQNVFSKDAGSGSSIDGFTGRTNYISFGSGGSTSPRFLTLNNLDLSQKASINFDLIKGNNTNGGELPDFGEGLTLEYSTDGIKYYTLVSVPSNDPNLGNWSTKTINLPPEAQKNSTKIRFRQELSSGGKLDQWGLANISFNDVIFDEPPSTSISTEPKYDWSFNNISGSARNVYRTSGGAGTSGNDGFAGKTSYVVFGGDGSAGERYLTYNPLDLSMKQNISFDLIRGNGTNGGDSPNINAEGLSLLYSTDNGVTFKTLKSYSFNDPSLTSWMTDSIALPKEAQTESTILKFYQPQSSGAPYDHWGLSNIAFTDTPPKPEVVPQLVYSRAGNFGVDKDGYVVNPSGFKLMGTDIKTGKTNKAVRIPSADPVTNQPLQAVSINNKGVVSATYGAGPSVDLYRISIATFASDAGLKPLGNVAFAQTGASGTAKISNAGEGSGGNVMAGTLEQANVDITNELMAMIAAQQIYNGNARMLQSQIEALKRLTDNI